MAQLTLIASGAQVQYQHNVLAYMYVMLTVLVLNLVLSFVQLLYRCIYNKHKMEVVITKSIERNTMPELMALKLHHSAKEGQATSPNMNI